MGDAEGQRQYPGRPVSKACPCRRAVPVTPSPPHPSRVRPSTPRPRHHRRPQSLRVASATQDSQPTLRASGWGDGDGRGGWIPGLEEKTQARRTLHANSGGLGEPEDHPAETQRLDGWGREPGQGLGRGSPEGGRGAVPRRSGDGTPPWCLRLSSGAERRAGRAPRPRTGLRGDTATVFISGWSLRRIRLCDSAAPPSCQRCQSSRQLVSPHSSDLCENKGRAGNVPVWIIWDVLVSVTLNSTLLFACPLLWLFVHYLSIIIQQISLVKSLVNT